MLAGSRRRRKLIGGVPGVDANAATVFIGRTPSVSSVHAPGCYNSAGAISKDIVQCNNIVLARLLSSSYFLDFLSDLQNSFITWRISWLSGTSCESAAACHRFFSALLRRKVVVVSRWLGRLIAPLYRCSGDGHHPRDLSSFRHLPPAHLLTCCRGVVLLISSRPCLETAGVDANSHRARHLLLQDEVEERGIPIVDRAL